MAKWREYLDGLIEDTNSNIRTFFRSMEDLDNELAEKRGLGSGILRGIFKSFTILYKAIFTIGHKVFPGPLADPKIIFAIDSANVPNESWSETIQTLANMFGLEAEDVKLLDSFAVTLAGTSPIIQGVSRTMMFVAIFQFLMGPSMGKINQTLMQRFRPVAADPGSVLGARGLDPELDARIWDVMRRAGLKDSDIELMFAATYQRAPENRLRDIYFREGHTKEWAMHRLHESGVTPERAEELYSTWKVIPGIQDLIMMQAKEAFEPDLIAKFGLGAEAPEEIYEWTRKLGLEDHWTEKYWSSHWVHASYGQVMEMLHRGYIEMADVWEWYKLVEIPPYWRDLLTKIAYHPYTRVDVRRMHAEGVVDDEDLIQSMKDIGYDQEHAEGMADFYKKYNARSGKELSRTDIEKAYEDRDLTYSQAVNLLQSVGYDEQTAIFYISRIELEMQRATRLERIELTKQKLLSNLIDTAKARNLLIGYGVDINRVNELIDRWEVQITANAKLPSKTDLDKFVRAKIIDQNQYKVEMSKLGYSDYYVSLYWQYLETGVTE